VVLGAVQRHGAPKLVPGSHHAPDLQLIVQAARGGEEGFWGRSRGKGVGGRGGLCGSSIGRSGGGGGGRRRKRRREELPPGSADVRSADDDAAGAAVIRDGHMVPVGEEGVGGGAEEGADGGGVVAGSVKIGERGDRRGQLGTNLKNG
jgi:hypothetical protein